VRVPWGNRKSESSNQGVYFRYSHTGKVREVREHTKKVREEGRKCKNGPKTLKVRVLIIFDVIINTSVDM